MNLDHNNPQHILTNEANDLLSIVEAANMRHMSNKVPTWKSYGFHKVCKCSDCDCERNQRSSCFDNAYVSLDAEASLKVLEDAITDHYPLLIELKASKFVKSNLESVWRRNTSKIIPLEFETALGLEDWSNIYESEDPNFILETIISNIDSSLDKVAPLKLMKFRKNKPSLNLRKDTLSAMTARDRARKSGRKVKYKQ